MNKYAIWFGRAMWLGIIIDWVLAIPTIFAPEWVLGLLQLEPTQDPVWTAFAALLVFLLSLFYIPGANQPYRNRFSAWFGVLARPPGVMFFFILYPGAYPLFGLVDLGLFLIQLPLLLLALKEAPPEEAPEQEPTAAQAPPDDNSPLWLKRTLWAGIILDWVLAVPAIFAPQATLNLLGLRPTGDPVWTAFAALILVLLAIGYVPGANQPYRFRYNANLAVFARAPGVLFFFGLWRGFYPLFGFIDLVLFLSQFYFLIRTMQLRPLRRFDDNEVFDYRGSSYNEVKEAAFSDPYPTLPKHPALGPTTFIQFLNDSARNMHDRRDIRPHYDKLIHAYGVCYAGLWKIDQESVYTGYFAKGSEGLLIARISIAGLFPTQGKPRTLGIAGKVFPTKDPDERVWPGNFVTVSHLSGSRAKHVLDIVPANFATVGFDPIANVINRFIFRSMDTRPGYRQLFPISTLGLQPNDPVVTPDLMQLKPAAGTPRIDAEDFRDEIRLRHYPDQQLVFDIEVRNFDETEWTRLGSLILTEDTISVGSDKRLHFWIPRDIPNVAKPTQPGAQPA